MNQQELFDKVATHLLKQGRRSEDETQCCYRGPDGLMCAIGCVIPDHCYTPAMEGAGLWQHPTPESLRDSSPKSAALYSALECASLTDGGVYDLLRDLQSAHDNHEPCEWAGQLHRIAGTHDLNTAVLPAPVVSPDNAQP